MNIIYLSLFSFIFSLPLITYSQQNRLEPLTGPNLTPSCSYGYKLIFSAPENKYYCITNNARPTHTNNYGDDFSQPKNSGIESKGTQPSQKQTDSFSQCESAYKKTQVTCNGQTIAPAVTALLNSVAQMKSSGNIKAACESAKKVSA